MGNSGAGCYFHASKEAVGSCVNCGKLICRACHSEIDGKSYCPRCIEKLFSTVQSGTPVTPSKSSGKQKQTATPVSSVTSDKGEVNPFWWLLPIFLSWVGGLAAWLANKDKNASTARFMLLGGLGMTFIQALIVCVLVLTLMMPLAAKPKQQPPDIASTPSVSGQQSAAPTEAANTPPTTPASEPLPIQSTPDSTVQSQPDDYNAEKSKIDSVVKQICDSLKAKDVEGTLKYFSEGERDIYRKAFTKSPDIMPEMAVDLEKARLNFLSFNSDEHSRIAEYLVDAGGQTASIVFINIDGQWLLKAF